MCKVWFSLADWGIERSASCRIAERVEGSRTVEAQVPLDRLLLETDSPDGLPCINDAGLARKVEAAAGSGLRVLPASAEGSATGCGYRCGGGSDNPAASSVVSGRRAGSQESSDGSGAANCAGSSGSDPGQAICGSGEMIRLDWRCPLDVAVPGGGSVLVKHPRQLLNQPANVR